MALDLIKLASDLERDEGFRSAVYDDATTQLIIPGYHVVGYPTIGIGWNLAGNPLSRERARIILGWHIEDKINELFIVLPWAELLDEVRCRALVNMAFNLGVPGLLKFHDTLAALKEHRWADAGRHALESKWATQVGARAKRIAHAFTTGTDGTGLIA